jgi:hypothetical protein
LEECLGVAVDDAGVSAHRLEDISEDDFSSNAETSSQGADEEKCLLAEQKRYGRT